LIEQIVTPLDRAPNGLLAGWEIVRPALQKRQPIAEPHQQRLGWKQLAARGRQLERQRQPVQPLADLGHHWCILVGHREVSLDRLGALDEQAYRLVLGQAIERRQLGAIGQLKRRYGELALAREAQRDPAGDEQLELGTRCQQFGKLRCSLEYLLEVVEQQQQCFLAQIVLEALKQRPASPLRDARWLGDRRDDQGRVADRRQIDDVDAIRKLVERFSRGLQRQASFADPAGARQCEQPRIGTLQDGLDGGQLLRASDQRGRLCGQIAAAAFQGAQRREGSRQFGDDDLKDLLRAGQV